MAAPTVASVAVLGVEVSTDLVDRWRGWVAPPVQPFVVDAGQEIPGEASGVLTPELRDTFHMWKVGKALRLAWLTEEAFGALPVAERRDLLGLQVKSRRGGVPSVRAWRDLLDPVLLRSQAGGHRFVWWPSLLGSNAATVLARIVASENDLPSKQAEVDDAVWDACAELLPGARRLAGTFPTGSGANCFSTVMAAAGVPDVADEWVLGEPFEAWLGEHTRSGGRDHSAGTVLVWRDRDGDVRHAAVTIGGGWALQKASQCWFTPRVVLPVRDLIRTSRSIGERLARCRLR